MKNLNPLYEGILGKIVKFSIKKGYEKGKEGIDNIRSKMDKNYKKHLELKKKFPDMSYIEDIPGNDSESDLDYTDYVMI